MAKKNKREKTYLEQLTDDETRNFDQLPKWKQRAIKRERENEQRLEEEQNTRDMKRGTGAYHPEAIAAQEKKSQVYLEQASKALETKTNTLISKIYEGWEQQPYFEGFAPEGVQFSGKPGISKENVAFRDFWTDPKFPEVVKEIQYSEGKKASKSLGVPAELPSLDITTGAGSKTAPENAPSRLNPVVWNKKPEVIEKEPVDRVSGLKRPAYLFDLNGNPFTPSDISLQEQIKMATKDSPNWLIREALPVISYLPAAFIDATYGGVDLEVAGRTIKGLTWGGMSEEDWVYQEDPNGPQATIQMAFNLGTLGYETLRTWWGVYGAIRDSAWNQDKFVALEVKKSLDENTRRLQEAWDATLRSWDVGTKAWQKEIKEQEDAPYLLNSAEYAEYIKQKNEQKKEQTIQTEQEAFARSENYFKSAVDMAKVAEQTYDVNERNQLYNNALEQQIMSIEWRRKSDPMDAWGAATWQREPERYDDFIRNAAFLELQLGRPLNVTEIRRLKDLYTNTGTEMAFQLVFDITNIVPALGSVTGVTDIIKNSRFIKFAKTLSMDTKMAVNRGVDAIPVVRWIRKAAVNSTAHQIASNVDNLTRRMMSAYGSTPELINELKKLEPLLLDFKAARTVEEQTIVFEKARQLIPGTNNWALADFKRFADSYDPKTMTNMAEVFGNARRNVQQSVYDTLKSKHPDWDDARLTMESENAVNKPYFVQLTTERFGHYLSEAYKETHRIFTGSALTDDTLIGNFVKSMALLFSRVPGASGRKLNESVFKYGRDLIADSPFRQLLVKIAESDSVIGKYLGTPINQIAGFSLDEFIVNFLSPGFHGKLANVGKMFLVDGIDYAFRMFNIMKQFWMTNVLTVPRWFITNFIDSAGRSFIYGEDTFSDIVTLAMSTQRYWDGVGPVPIPREMSTSLVHPDAQLLDEVSNRLVYMNAAGELSESRKLEDLPESGLNIYAVWRREHKRLYKKARDAKTAPNFQGLPEGVKNWALNRTGKNINNPLSKTWDWIRTGLFVAPYGTVADVNAAIEYTLRSRMFMRNYTKYMDEMERSFVTALIKNNPEYSALLKETMERINREAGGSPAKIEALVKALIKDPENAYSKFHSLDLPVDWMANTKMAPDKAQMFTATVLDNWGKYKETVLKATGNPPTAEQRDAFFNQFRKNMEVSYQEVIAQRAKEYKTAEMDDTINPRGIPRDMPNPSELRGSTPNMDNVRKKRMEAALGVLKPRGRKVSPDTIKEAFSDVMSDFSTVNTSVKGDAVKVTVSNGKPEIQIGSDFWNKPRTQMISELYGAAMDMVGIREAKSLKVLDLSVNQFKDEFEEFAKDPARVFARNDKLFVFFMSTMEKNEDIFKVLESMSGDKFASIEGVQMIWRESMNSKYSYEYFSGDEQALLRWMDSEAAKIKEPDWGYSSAGVEKAAARVRLIELSKSSVTPEFKNSIVVFDSHAKLVEDKMHKYARLVYPGPMRLQVGETRGAMWDMYFLVAEKGYKIETEYLRQIEQIAAEEGHEAAAKFMNDLLPDYEEKFLRKLGLDIVWTDESKTEIFHIKNRLDRRTQTWYKGELRFDALKAYFFPGKGKAKTLELATSETVPLKMEISAKVRAATGIKYQQAQAWTSMMELHAERWMDITGGTLEEYFKRFSFEAGTTSAPYIKRMEDGTYRFTLTPQGDLPTLLRQTAEVLFADMEELSKLDPVAAAEYAKIQDAIINSTPYKEVASKSKPLTYRELNDSARVAYRMELKNKLGDGAFIDLWNSAEKVFGKNKFSNEMVNGVLELKKTYKLDNEDLTKFILSLPPELTKADAKRLLKELNAMETADTADMSVIFTDLFLEYLEEGMAPEGFPAAFNQFSEWLANDYQVMKRMNFDMDPEVEKALNGIFMDQMTRPTPRTIIRDAADAYMEAMGANPKEIRKEIQKAKRAARAAMKGEAVNDVPSGELLVGAEFKMVPSIETLSLDELEALALKNAKDAQVPPLADEVRQAWNLFVSSRKYLQQFPPEATADPFRFMQYAKTRAVNMSPDTADVYERMAADVDFFLRDVIGAKKPYPKVADFQVNNGVRTFLRASEDITGNFHEMDQAMKKFQSHLNATGGAPVLDEQSKKQLLEWAPRFSQEKAKAINVATYGGEYGNRLYEGAIPYVNKIMLDYTDQNRFDLIAKNLFPFWMFPSRSLPFWAKTMATHPELVAFYTKMQRWSNAYRAQAGAVTSDGRPLDSLDGYMPIPGTDIWVNPLAPMSFKYVLGIPEMVEELARNSSYAGFSDEEIDPVSWSIRKLLEIGPSVGFNLPPWVLLSIKEPFGIPDASMPKFPLTPWIPLVPRWMVYDLVNKSKTFGDIVYPEATFQEANVERRMYQNALAQIQAATSDEEKTRIVNEVITAVIERRGNALWDETYKELTNQQALQAAGSYFTGYYAKPFSDSQAELYALRNELNMLKSSLNSEIQASIFKLDGDAQTRWDRYLEYIDTPESDLYRLYVQSGWVRDAEGNLVTDPAERANYLKQAIEADQEQSAYYAGLEQAKKQLDASLRNLKVGSPYELTDKVYDNYYDRINDLKGQTTFTYDRSFGTWKPVELIEKEIRDEFYRTLLSSRPLYYDGMDWKEYQARILDWENRVPQIALRILSTREPGRLFQDRADINAIVSSLHEDQKLSASFWSKLLAEASTPEGFKLWQKEQDDVFDALNNAWSELYWKPYWRQLGDLEGAERDLFEEDFAAQRPPPDTQELYNWIRMNYGTRFSLDEIRQWVEGTEVMDIEQRLNAQRTEEQKLRSQVWDYLSWLGPSKDQEALDYLQGAMREKLEQQGVLNLTGKNPLEDVMEHNELLYTGRPDILKLIVDTMEQVYLEKNVQKPTREQLVQYVKAQDSNSQFKQLVNKEFPELIQRGSIPPYNLIQSWQSDYFMVEDSRSYSYKYKHDHPTEYSYLRKYWDMKKQYGRVDPVWGMYYNMSEDKKNVPVQLTGLFDMDPALGKDLKYEGDIPSTAPKPNQSPSTFRQTERQRRQSRPEPKSTTGGGGSTTGPNTPVSTPAELPGLSPSLRRSMGTMLSREVNKMIYEKRKLSAPAVEFLTGLAERHPEWSGEIQSILEMNTTP